MWRAVRFFQRSWKWLTYCSFMLSLPWRSMLEMSPQREDSQWIKRSGWVQLRTPSSSQSIHNRVFYASLGSLELEACVNEVMEDHRQRGAGLSWVVSEDSRPQHLATTLLKQGMKHIGTAKGLVRPVTSDERAISIPHVHVHLVKRSAGVRSASGFGLARIAGFGRHGCGDGRARVEWE